MRLKALALCVLGVSPCIVEALPANATVVTRWNDAALAEVRLSKLGPPVVARALAIAHTCMYDAWVPFDSRAQPLTAAIGRRPVAERSEANKATAVSFAAYRCLTNLFPAGAIRLESVMRSLGYEPLDNTTDTTTPQGIGNAAAAAVIADRRNDGANQYGDLRPGAYADYSNYASLNAPMGFCQPATVGPCQLNISNPYHWQPLTNNAGVVQVFVAPHWENVRPFALASGAQFDALKEFVDGPAYLKNPSKYKKDVETILAASRDLTPGQKLIVEYWADGPASELPPGHWSLFAQFIAARDSHGIDDDVKMYFAMQNASFDAGIVAWHLKRKFDGVRPITAIRYFKQGTTVLAWGGPGRPTELIDGAKWSPYNPGSNLTPSFPGFVSGHSTFSSASAFVLRAITGTDTFGYAVVLPANFGRVEPGIPAVPTTFTFPTMTSAVQEAGLSRLYAGIHYPDDNTDGQLLGTMAAQQAWAKAYALFNGVAAAAGPEGGNVVCANALLGAATYANVEVPAGTRCALLNTRVTGNVMVRSGALLDASNASVDGGVSGQNVAAVQLAGGRIGGALQIAGSQSVSIAGVSAGSVRISGNVGPLTIRDARVNYDVELSANGSAVASRNLVGGSLRCVGNLTVPTGTGNTASNKEAQCASL